MPFYKTTFYRSCYSFGQEVKQSFDVVFECAEKEFTKDKEDLFYKLARDAAQNQIPTIDYKNSGLPMGSGWSSVIGGYTYKRLAIPWLRRKLQKPSPGKPVIGCAYSTPTHTEYDGTPRSYRATGFFKFARYTPGADPVMLDIFPDLGKERWILVKCLPKEAQIISGAGICGHLDLISNVVVGDLVPWSENDLKREQYYYGVQVKKELADIPGSLFHNNDILRHYGKEWMEQLNLTP